MKTLKYYFLLFNFVIFCNMSFPQVEFDGQSISYPKFFNEQFSLNKVHRVINAEELDSIVTITMEQYHIPGLTAMVVKYDSIIWSNNYGYSNIAMNQPAKDSTLFLMASISKTIMATALMQLWEEGLFDLNENINNYLQPEFQVKNPYFPNDTITVKMLMTHTSSIKDNWNILIPVVSCGDSPIALDSFLVNYFTPGGVYYSTLNFNNYSPYANYYNYSNAGACILAYLIEKLSGMPFDQYCRINIFDPLDMDESSWFLEGLDTTEIATPYDWVANQYYANCHQGWPLYPVAFLRTNKIELSNFLSAYMNNGIYNGNTILDSATINIMLSDQMGHPDPYGDYQGLIWYETFYDGRWLWGHTGGWTYGTATAMFYVPEEDWGFMFFMNTYPDAPAFWGIFQALSDYAIEWQVPVELTSFTATAQNGYVELNWSTATETNNQMFEIERRKENSDFVLIGFAEGTGTTTERQEYSYVDRDVTTGKYFYRLKQIDYNGTYEYLPAGQAGSIEIEVDATPVSFSLEQNYPNPFNPSTTIKFNLPEKEFVTIKVYDVMGNEVATLINDEKPAGSLSIEFDASDLASGSYFYKLQAGNNITTRKMILLK
jgi:CubicO group peptidase (beta-lactamase class C family)